MNINKNVFISQVDLAYQQTHGKFLANKELLYDDEVLLEKTVKNIVVKFFIKRIHIGNHLGSVAIKVLEDMRNYLQELENRGHVK